MQTFDVPGVGVAVVKDDEVVFAKGYGVRKLGETTSVDSHTLFGIGSNTKAFTTASLGILKANSVGTIAWWTALGLCSRLANQVVERSGQLGYQAF
jgi:hypothetical protein